MPRRKFQPSEEQRRTVKRLAGLGLRPEQICTMAHIPSTRLLLQHFAEELARGPVEASAKVMGTAFRMATFGRNPAMLIFLLKTRARWSERGFVAEPELSDGGAEWIIEIQQPPRSFPEQADLDRWLGMEGDGHQGPPEWDGDRVDRDDD